MDESNAEEIKNLIAEAEALKQVKEAMGSEQFARKVFEKVYFQDINRLRSMEDAWEERTKPEVFIYDELLEKSKGLDIEKVLRDTQRKWTLEENFRVFVNSINKLATRYVAAREKGDSSSILTFDKDDEDAMNFIVAAANLRSESFKIETKSKFDLKRKQQ